MAADGYPDSYKKGSIIKNIPKETADLKVFHAGTKLMDNVIYSSGGRVMCVTALGENTQIAKERSYESIKEIEWED